MSVFLEGTILALQVEHFESRTRMLLTRIPKNDHFFVFTAKITVPHIVLFSNDLFPSIQVTCVMSGPKIPRLCTKIEK